MSLLILLILCLYLSICISTDTYTIIISISVFLSLFLSTVILSDRADAAFEESGFNDGDGDTTGWLSSVSAPEPSSSSSPYFGRGNLTRKFGRG